jgi:hypothetical protein
MTVQLEQKPRPRVAVRTDLLVVAAAAVAAVGAWWVWTQVASVDLAVHRGDTTQSVGVAAVVLTVLVMAGSGVGLLRLLEARTANGLRTWTIVASVVFALSLLGPLGATTVAAGVALASLHAITAGLVVQGLRRARRRERSGGVA